MADWYPKTQAEVIAWHDNFSTQAAINGTTLGLTAGIITQIAADADNVLIMLNGLEAASAYLPTQQPCEIGTVRPGGFGSWPRYPP